LIDIKMPGRLGLDIIREVRENGFSGKFIIVSGYSNFDYAKDAIIKTFNIVNPPYNGKVIITRVPTFNTLSIYTRSEE
ncbi:AraC-type DNA-binding protein, partial [human gut metagenome]